LPGEYLIGTAAPAIAAVHRPVIRHRPVHVLNTAAKAQAGPPQSALLGHRQHSREAWPVVIIARGDRRTGRPVGQGRELEVDTMTGPGPAAAHGRGQGLAHLRHGAGGGHHHRYLRRAHGAGADARV